MTRSRRETRDIHGLNAEGFVACNPRDREAAHRAKHHGIASENPRDVTCPRCRAAAYRGRRAER